MRRRLTLVLVLALLWWRPPAWAFELGGPSFQSVGDAESIPDNFVSALAEDRSGFLWVGTPAGLLRYDGYRFQRFGSEIGESATAKASFVRALLVSSDGRLWVGTDADGLLIYDPGSGRVEQFRHDPKDAGSLAHSTVWALAEDRHGGVWIGTQGGLDYRPKGGSGLVHHRHRSGDSSSLNDDRILALRVDRDGDLWVGSGKGLNRLRSGASEFESIHSDPGRTEPLAGKVLSILFEAHDGRLWFGTTSGAGFILDRATQHLEPIDQASGRVALGGRLASIAQPIDDEVWIARTGRIDVVGARNGRLLRSIRAEPALRYGLAGFEIRALLCDRSGQLWIGGYGTGLQRLDPRRNGVRVLRYSPTQTEGLSSPGVGGLLELDSGEIWVGTNLNGIDILDRERGVVAGIRPASAAGGVLPNGWISALAQSRDRSVWVGIEGGMVRIDPDTHVVRAYGSREGFENIGVRRLLASRTGGIWIGTAIGLWRWTPQDDRVSRIDGVGGDPVRDAVNGLVEDAEGRLWVGTVRGLYALPTGATQLRPVRPKPGSLGELPHASVLGLLFDRDGRLWIDTPLGLSRMRDFDGQYAKFDDLSARLGIGGQPFGANLLEDAAGRIWTQRYVYDPSTEKLFQLSRADGIDFGSPWFRVYTQTRDGLLLFGGSTGLLIIDPTRFQPWIYAPPVVVSELKIDGVPQAPAALTKGLSLTPEQRRFSVEFAALDLSAPERNRYSYRLEGYDADWIAANASHRFAGYNDLWPGSYTLRVRGSNRNGTWSPHELSVAVRVLPAFWQTPWFAGLCLFALAAGAYGGLRWRTARINRHARHLQVLVDRRTVELSSMLAELQQTQRSLVEQEKMASLGGLVAGVAHELNTPLGVALTSISHLKARTSEVAMSLAKGQLRKPDLDGFITDADESESLVERNLVRSAELVRSFKEVAVSEHGGEVRQFEVRNAIADAMVFLDAKMRAVSIRPSVECDESLSAESYAGTVVRIISQLLDNALVHAFSANTSGQIVIAAQAVDPGSIELTVRDNGRGIPADELVHIFEPFFTTRRGRGGTGLGLHICYNLAVQQLKGTLRVESTFGLGTQFFLKFPQQAI